MTGVRVASARLGHLRPTSFDSRQHAFDQAPRLTHDVGPGRPQDEFLDADRDILADPLEDRRLVTDGEIARRFAPRALRIGLHRRLYAGIVHAAEIEGNAGAVVILVDRSTRLGDRLLDRRHDLAGVDRRLAAGLPAGAVARRAPNR